MSADPTNVLEGIQPVITFTFLLNDLRSLMGVCVTLVIIAWLYLRERGRDTQSKKEVELAGIQAKRDVEFEGI